MVLKTLSGPKGEIGSKRIENLIVTIEVKKIYTTI